MRLRLNRYLIMLMLPAIMGAFIAKYVADYLEGLLSPRIMEASRITIPDIPEAGMDAMKDLDESLGILSRVRVNPKVAQTDKSSEPPPKYKLTFIYIGVRDRYVIINGRILKEGDMVSAEEKIIKIDRRAVLLSGKWGERWIRLLD